MASASLSIAHSFSSRSAFSTFPKEGTSLIFWANSVKDSKNNTAREKEFSHLRDSGVKFVSDLRYIEQLEKPICMIK